jgi:hypothetical protein
MGFFAPRGKKKEVIMEPIPVPEVPRPVQVVKPEPRQEPVEQPKEKLQNFEYVKSIELLPDGNFLCEVITDKPINLGFQD